MASDKNKARTEWLSAPLKPPEPPAKALLPDIQTKYDGSADLALEDRSPANDEAAGFNPYDTAALYEK